MKVTDLTENQAINFPTQKEYDRVMEKFYKIGATWKNGLPIEKFNGWRPEREQTVIFKDSNNILLLGHQKPFGESGFEIIPSEQIYDGDIADFPYEIVKTMLDRQEEQGNDRDVSVFEGSRNLGFIWNNTPEDYNFWYNVIFYEDFDTFYEKYPQLKKGGEFSVHHEVWDKEKIKEWYKRSKISATQKQVAYTVSKDTELFGKLAVEVHIDFEKGEKEIRPPKGQKAQAFAFLTLNTKAFEQWQVIGELIQEAARLGDKILKENKESVLHP